MSPSWTHLCRFLAEEDGQVHLGEVDATKWPDVGVATYNGEKVDVKLVTGSIFDGSVTNTTMHISRVRAVACKDVFLGVRTDLNIASCSS